MEPTSIATRKKEKGRPKLKLLEKITILQKVIHKLDSVKEVA